MTAIIKRELRAYFTSPLGYVLLAVLALFGGINFANVFSYGYADMTYVLSPMITTIFFVIPILTMRLFSEEKKQKTDQLLMTSPVSLRATVLGKFFAAVIFFCAFVALCLLFNIVFMFFASPDWMVFLGNVVGLLLFASSLIAIGIFISALTESQVVAAVGSFAVSFFLMLLNTVSSIINNSVVTKICDWISFSARYQTFTQGIFDIPNTIFFLSIIAVFLFLTVRVLDRKRWA